jgi:hypothetical protein
MPKLVGDFYELCTSATITFFTNILLLADVITTCIFFLMKFSLISYILFFSWTVFDLPKLKMLIHTSNLLGRLDIVWDFLVSINVVTN